MSDEILEVWKELEAELKANQVMWDNHQRRCEDSIANVAALKTLSNSGIEEAVKNL